MKKKILIFLVGFVFFGFILTLTNMVCAEDQESDVDSQTIISSSAEYQGIYKQGDAPFKKKTDIRIARTGDFFEFIPKKGEVWAVSVKSLRGARAVAKGVWFFWFDNAGETRSAYIAMSVDSLQFAGDINKVVDEVNKDPNLEYRARFEAYKDEALKMAE